MDTIVPAPVSIGLANQVVKVLESNGIGAADLQRFIDDLSYRAPIIQAFRPDLSEPARLPDEFDEGAMIGLLQHLFKEDYATWRKGEENWAYAWDENPFEMFAKTAVFRDLMGDLSEVQKTIVNLRSGLADNQPVKVELVAGMLGLTVTQVNAFRSEANYLIKRKALWMGRQKMHAAMAASQDLGDQVMIQALNLSPRLLSALEARGAIRTVGDLRSKTRADIRDIRNMGPALITELETVMKKHNLFFRED